MTSMTVLCCSLDVHDEYGDHDAQYPDQFI